MFDPNNPLSQNLPAFEQHVGSDLYNENLANAQLQNKALRQHLEHQEQMATAQREYFKAKQNVVNIGGGALALIALLVIIPVVGGVWSWGIKEVFGG